MPDFLKHYEPIPDDFDQNEPEPRVVTRDVADILRTVVRPDEDDVGSSVLLIAEKANTSTRTVYRVLSESTPTINLDLADRLCLAADSHLGHCRLSFADGSERPYIDDGDILLILART